MRVLLGGVMVLADPSACSAANRNRLRPACSGVKLRGQSMRGSRSAKSVRAWRALREERWRGIADRLSVGSQ